MVYTLTGLLHPFDIVEGIGVEGRAWSVGFGGFAVGSRRTIRRTIGLIGTQKRRTVRPIRLLAKMVGMNRGIAGFVFRGLKMGKRRVTLIISGRVSSLPGISNKRPCLDERSGRMLRGTARCSGRVNSRFISLRRLLLTLLAMGDATSAVLGSTNVTRGRLHDTVDRLHGKRGMASRSDRSACRSLRGCTVGLGRTTHDNGLSPMVKQSRRVQHMLRVLDHHAGGGPVLVNRPNANGATVMRNLTRHVLENSMPRGLESGRMCSLSVNTLMTNTGCGNRFRRQLGSIIGRMVGSRKGVVLFVSRVRALINTKGNRNTVSTTGVLGPTLTHKRLHTVNTAALSRCRGCFRGSGTLRHHFRVMRISRPSALDAVSVLHKLGRHCRGRRRMHVGSSTVVTTMRLDDHCVASHFLPSGTVSLVSRTTTGLHVRMSSIPRSLSRVSHGVGRLRVRHRTVGHRGSRPGLSAVNGRVTRLGRRRGSFGTG